MSISVLIPTYKNVEYLAELFLSIESNNFANDYEVLLGIDNCDETLEYVLSNKFPNNFKFIFFKQNYGPYIIKNTLFELSQYDKIFYFDSDDIMLPSLLSEMNRLLDHYDCVKPKYLNFKDSFDGKIFEKESNVFGEGVFGMKKETFKIMNGFEGWRVAADSDFMGRYYKTNPKLINTKEVLFHRRLHPKSLTINPETNYSSQIRHRYYQLSKNKTHNDIKLENMLVGEYEDVTDSSKIYSLDEQYHLEEQIKEQIQKNKMEQLSLFFFNRPKNVIKNPEINKLNYQQINLSSNSETPSNLDIAIKKAKLENIQKNSRKR